MFTPDRIWINDGQGKFRALDNLALRSTSTFSMGVDFADLDVVMNNLHTMAGVYRNECVAPRVAVRLKGIPPNTQGIGAKIQVLGGPVPQSQEMICGGRYLSGDDPMRVFAAGSLANKPTIEVTWRNGKQSVVKAAEPNRIYEIDEAGAHVAANPHPSTPRLPDRQVGGQVNPPPFFEDVSALLAHKHVEVPFDDFERQPLLPNRLSQLGPGVCWHDLDGDGWEDLFIGSGKGGGLAIYRNNGQGGFTPIRDHEMTRVTTRDHTTILGAGAQLFVGFSN